MLTPPAADTRVEEFQTTARLHCLVRVARVDVVHPRPGRIGMTVRGVVVARPTDAGPADDAYRFHETGLGAAVASMIRRTQSMIQAPISFTSGASQ